MLPAVMLPAVSLLDRPAGVWWTLATVTALAVVTVVSPLRGGHGQHADPGPGALHVWQLSAPPRPEKACPQPETIVWPTEMPEADPRPSRSRERQQGPTPLERELAELCELVAHRDSESDRKNEYVGRHRLVEPVVMEVYAPPPWGGCRVSRRPHPVAA